MKSARLIWMALLAFLAVAIFLVLLAATSFNPFAQTESIEPVTPTRAAIATRRNESGQAQGVATRRNESGQAQGVAPTDQPTLVPNNREGTRPPDQPTLPANASEAFQQGVVARRNGDYVRAATAFRAAAQTSSDPALARQAQFQLGEALYLAADFTNAVPALEAVVQQNDGDALAPRAHYFLGDIFTQQQKYEAALEQLKIYRAHTRALMGVVDREIGDVLLASGDSAAAIRQYEAAFKDPTFNNAQRAAVLKKIAEVYHARQEPQLAAVRLEEAFKIAPDNATRANVEYLWGEALYAMDEQDAALGHWKHALATYTLEAGAHQSVAKLVELGVTDINELQRGIANYGVGNYDLAIQAFRRYIAANDVPGAEVLYYAGLAYQRKGDQAGALRNLDVLLSSYPQDKRVPDALFAKAVSQTRLGDSAAALATLRQLLKRAPDDARIDDAFWNAALAYELAGNYAQAGAVYTELAKTFPASGFAPFAYFNGGVSYYLAQNYTRAKADWNAALENYPASPHADSAAYWLGKLARLQGDEKSAVKFFQLATQPPRSYYSWRAFDALNQPAPPPSYKLDDYAMEDTAATRAELEQWIASWSGAPAAAELPPAVLNDAAFKRGSEYASLSRALDARPQFQIVNETFKNDAAALYALALYYKDNNYFSLSIDAATRLAALSKQNETTQPRLLRQLIYPTYYADLIVPYAQRHKFDPALFFGLVRQESTFNPLSYSSAEARGLTQVIPGTGDLIARALGVSDFKQNDLFKPYVSVRFGTYYLGNVLESFNGNIYYALMGYNGGPGNARKWMKPDLDTAVEAIPYAESHLYVRTVVAQYRQYANIYRERANKQE
ncbi:MAG: tetratricopeptide repeat protein [Chloroflexi bacterium]|nr:tetratricopeptide repeat protein [Chloroflexota bacterium]